MKRVFLLYVGELTMVLIVFLAQAIECVRLSGDCNAAGFEMGYWAARVVFHAFLPSLIPLIR